MLNDLLPPHKASGIKNNPMYSLQVIQLPVDGDPAVHLWLMELTHNSDIAAS
jgi:hypothetical protein